MRTRFLLPCVMFTAMAATGTSSAATYSAEARVFGTSNVIPTGYDSEASNFPVSVLAGTRDPFNASTEGAAGGRAGQGSVDGLTVTSSGGQRLIGVVNASAIFNDVLFSWQAGGPAPDTSIRAGLRFGIEHEQEASGPLGNSNGRNYREFTANVSFNGAGDSARASYDVGGNSVSPNLGGRVLWADVPIGSAVAVRFDLQVASAAFMAARPGPTTTSMLAVLRVGSVDVQPAGLPPLGDDGMAWARTSFAAAAAGVDPSLLAFVLPDGYTANSVSMGVVDNVWVAGQKPGPVPEPASTTTLLLGLALLGAAGRRRCPLQSRG